MKKRAVTTLALAVVLALSTVGSAVAAGMIGNEASNRGNADNFENFTIVDTNNSAAYDGSFSEIEYFAHQAGIIRFVLADVDQEVTWVSGEIDVPEGGLYTETFDAPVGVTVGDNLGVYSAGAGVVSFEFDTDADDAYYTPNNAGQPTVGQSLAGKQGESPRFYSMNATIIPAPPETKDACKNGGWETFGHEFRNQGECVSFLMANENAGKR